MKDSCGVGITLVQLTLVLGCLLLFSQGCGSDTPFPMEKVSGKITYDDGTLIPAKSIKIRFEPLAAPLDPKTHPRPGGAVVDVETGEFDEVTTYQYGDGLVRGRHKVLLITTAPEGKNNSTPLIPPVYSRVDETPLEVDVDDSPFHFQIPRP